MYYIVTATLLHIHTLLRPMYVYAVNDTGYAGIQPVAKLLRDNLEDLFNVCYSVHQQTTALLAVSMLHHSIYNVCTCTCIHLYVHMWTVYIHMYVTTTASVSHTRKEGREKERIIITST